MSESLTIKLRSRTPPQKRIHDSTKRFNIACWGRQSGKTTTGLDKIFYKPLQGREKLPYWYILQTYDAATVAFNRYKYEYYENARGLFLKKPNESDLSFLMRGNRLISFRSGKNYEDLRIETLGGAIIDEMRQQHPDLWPRVIRPMLGRNEGWADIYSTPNGFDHFYDLFEQAKIDSLNEWGHFHAPSTEAWWWTEKEIQSNKATMSEAEFSQEILAEFRDMTAGRVYFSYGEHNQRSDSPFNPGRTFSPELPVLIGLDFNLSPMSWVVGQTNKMDFHYSNEVYLTASHTQEASDYLIQEILKKEDCAEAVKRNGVILCGDATGKATQRTSNQSDYDILKSALKRADIKFTDKTPAGNPSVKDRVNAGNACMKAADGSIHFSLNPKTCPNLHKDLQRTVWKQNADGYALDPGPKKDRTHSSDAATYPIATLSPVKSIKTVGQTRVIVRRA